MKSAYEQLWEGEWDDIVPDYRLACCDCGLVHRMHFKVVGKKIFVRVFRDNRATAQLRRRNKLSKT